MGSVTEGRARRRTTSRTLKESAMVSEKKKPSIYPALLVIFLEFFAWGLLTGPMISLLNKTFPRKTFLMNGIIQGVKGFLSFLSAPLVGALSDVFGRKPFLLLTVSCTCAPIPLMFTVSPWWFFTFVSVSGALAVTFSVIFAYVADITTEDERDRAYGLVSATFAAALVSSPALGWYLARQYSDELVAVLASAIAALDILFIIVCVSESLPPQFLSKAAFSWKKADPFGSLMDIGREKLVLLLSVTVFLSYLPEAGEYSCFFVYLRLVLNFSFAKVSMVIAFIGIFSVLAQTCLMSFLLRCFGARKTIIIGLTCEMVQLLLYGITSHEWLLWTAGVFAAINSITYPALSAFTSHHASREQQGVSQGIITGIRGLCNGLGPALFGVIFNLFKVNLDHTPDSYLDSSHSVANTTSSHALTRLIPGPPFAFGSVLVLLAAIVACYIPNNPVLPPQSPVGDKEALLQATDVES